MYQMNIFKTGGLIKSVDTATWVVDWFQFELFYDFNSLQSCHSMLYFDCSCILRPLRKIMSSKLLPAKDRHGKMNKTPSTWNWLFFEFLSSVVSFLLRKCESDKVETTF